jgi:tetratricopeptide (TPR) repeat protein
MLGLMRAAPHHPPRPLGDPTLALLLFAAVLGAYLPALHGAPVWDDDAHITRAALQGLDGLWRIWTEPGATQQYYPVLHSAFWLEHRLWGDIATGYHMVNVVLHAISSCLVVLLARQLGVRGAWAAGFVFALHPVHVESVAWISEQKNTLSLALYLASALAWLRFDRTRRGAHWALAFGLFALALGAKTVTATLPCALLVVVWWQRGRIALREDVLPLLPWLVLGVVAGIGTAWMEHTVIGAQGAEFDLSTSARVLLAARALWHYLATFAWPTALAFTYERWIIDARSAAAWSAVGVVLLITTALWWWRGRARGPLAAWLVFAGTLFPVLGFLNVYPFRYAFVADHFQYHANVALALVSGAGVAWIGARIAGTVPSWVTRGSAAAVLLLLGALSWRYAGHYRDAETLYRATLAANPSSWMAHHNLGRLVSRRAGGLDEAITHFEAAIRLKPDHARARYSLAVALQRSGRPREAVPHLEAAIRDEPNNPMLVANAHYIIGDILRHESARRLEAIDHLREAVRRKPLVAQVHLTLGEALATDGQEREAAIELGEALRLQPGYAEALRALRDLEAAPPRAVRGPAPPRPTR